MHLGTSQRGRPRVELRAPGAFTQLVGRIMLSGLERSDIMDLGTRQRGRPTRRAACPRSIDPVVKIEKHKRFGAERHYEMDWGVRC